MAVVANVSTVGGCHKRVEMGQEEGLRETVEKNPEDSGATVFVF